MHNTDFNFLNRMIDEFIATRDFASKLKFIRDENINDWEKWLQLELQHFLHHHAEVGEVYREVPYQCDKRMSRIKSNMYIDLLLRKKGAKRDSYIQVELKCNHDSGRLLSNMFADWDKVNTMKLSGDDGRSFWCVGFYTTAMTDRKEKNLLSKLDGYPYALGQLPDGQAGGYIIC